MDIEYFYFNGVFDMKDLENEWFEKTKDSIESIRTLLTLTNDYDAEFVKLANWLTNTEHNPWGFMPSGWEGCRRCAQTYESFLDILHHAMVDDGDYYFVELEEFGGSFIALGNDLGYDDIQTLYDKRFRCSTISQKFIMHRDVSRFINHVDNYEINWAIRAEKREKQRIEILSQYTEDGLNND